MYKRQPLWTTLPELSNSTAESSNAFTASIYRLYGLLPYARIEEKGLTLGLTSARHGEGVTFILSLIHICQFIDGGDVERREGRHLPGIADDPQGVPDAHPLHRRR